ncbi:MAG: T9SS type A sorting domain-containing protein [Ignavibacteria bacterium]|nr:T9SS type A sorting domain-containing protein [Ignavibacteria bacterium]
MLSRLLISLLFLLSLRQTAFGQLIKFEELFDTLSPESRGWIILNNDGNLVDYPLLYEAFTFTNGGPMNPQAGRYFVKFDALNANEQRVIDEWLITPQLPVIEKYDEMSFWCGAVDKNFKDSLRVLVSVSGNQLADFTEIDRFKADGPIGAWHKKSYDLSAFAGKSVYFAVNYRMLDAGVLGRNSDNVWIDNFKLVNRTGPGVEITSYELDQNYPNPFNASTEIIFAVPEPSYLQIRIFDMLGRQLETAVEGRYEMGRYRLRFDASNLASGSYIYSIDAEALSGGGKFRKSSMMVLIK